MGSKLVPGSFDCYAAALPDEPMFVLLARDPSAPTMLRAWATQRRRDVMATDGDITDAGMEDLRKATEADMCADDMVMWRRKNDGLWRDGAEARAQLEDPSPEEMSMVRDAVTKGMGAFLGVPSQFHGGVIILGLHKVRRWSSDSFRGRRHQFNVYAKGYFKPGMEGPIDDSLFNVQGQLVCDAELMTFRDLGGEEYGVITLLTVFDQ